MKKHLVPAVAAAAAIVVGAFAPGLASAETLVPSPKIYMTEDKGALKFLAPATVYQGDELTVVNETNPKRVGPHTFSLVAPSTLPKTPKARKSCFTPKHICMSIAKWHGFDPKTERITINPVEAGPEGWSTMGNNSGKEGDSWFTGEKKAGTSYSQKVTAEPGTIYFMCAVHPWMQGKTKVLPAPVPVPLPLGS